ncbi:MULTISPECIES: aromatic hydrocarbon degradation protein [unclassified Dysgonomonas]|uniref:aromatic hydrocarbon degradation protein n=1 Tax=unclassified Dysgonomonas TaxID=2630389 RepID=UPI0024753067|nr:MULTISPECIES: aromatic hydrocarbon degradation protein [unclassified Dysgonomonas]
MKKLKFPVLSILLFGSLNLIAGGLLTNTNQSIHFLRNPARDASTSIDAVYTNPAGIIKLPEGFHFSINNQSAFQTRTIKTTFAPFVMSGNGETKKFKGEASVPIIPSVQGAYRKGNWALSGSIAITGGGGKATFNNGLPSFEAGASLLPGIINQVGAALNAQNPAVSLTANRYSVDQYMTGTSLIYGAQLGGAYKIDKMFSLYGGFRLNIVNNNYEGYLKNLQANPTSAALGYDGAMTNVSGIIDMALANPALDDANRAKLQLLKKASNDGARLDCDQSGWGISPILGINFSYEKLNIGLKYEFRTALNVENKTKIDDTHMFSDGVNTPHDIPGLLTVGVSYQVLPNLQASVGYHHFFDSEANMTDDKQKYINGGTDEFLGGLEFQINKMFMVSGGFQITHYGITDDYQKDLSFTCNSYSIGLGGVITVSPKVKINLGYFWTNYSDWTKKSDNYLGLGLSGKDVFSRTNKVFGAGVDFSF